MQGAVTIVEVVYSKTWIDIERKVIKIWKQKLTVCNGPYM